MQLSDCSSEMMHSSLYIGTREVIFRQAGKLPEIMGSYTLVKPNDTNRFNVRKTQAADCENWLKKKERMAQVTI
ncbi:hypothetical protein NQ317_014246 [Molorchus minor]|uniref:Uncharacterized protein n=1 Tax=Molorchus minor TaxID=1323400 RepID=A0ABQ9J5W2_9CUCU|nr:hypothetical protein NQ317_014246 [Molorchus minor]